MKVVSFSIFKGGTGKTTTSANTAALVRKGKRVLLVDLDQQASATRYLDLDPGQSANLYDVFMGTKPAQLAIRHTKWNIDMLSSPANSLYHVPIYHVPFPCDCCQCAENLAREYFLHENTIVLG